MTEPLLAIRDLSIDLATPGGMLPVLRNLSLELAAGRVLGLVGESGSGKTMLGLALLGLLPPGARVRGAIRFDGTDLVTLPEADRAGYRGRRIAMIFQDPMTALNPVLAIGTQLDDVLRQAHPDLGRAARRDRVLDLLARVGLPEPRRLRNDPPHRLSGGMRQRVVIAMALACDPALLIADEPTTALDPTIARQIMGLLADLRRDIAGAILVISHSLAELAGVCDEMAVLYAGSLVEQAPAGRFFAHPAHPYARALLACEIGEGQAGRLATVPGRLPDLGHLPAGCIFAPRCPDAVPLCRQPPPLRDLGGRVAACHVAAPE